MPVFSLPDADISYDVYGEGPALLFLSGTAWPGGSWKLHQVPEFARDHRVIVYDQRGTGKSPARGTDFTTKRLADDAAALLDHLGIEGAIVAGHSNGGRVAQLLIVEHPRKVAKLVLISSGATHGGRGVPIPMIVKLVEQGYREYMRSSSVATGCSPAYYAAHREQCDAFIELLLADLTPLETMLLHVVGRQESDTTSRLGEIRVPTLVMVGDDEKHSDAGTTHFQFAELLSERIAGAKLVVLPGAGHFYPWYEPEKTNALIREFITSALTRA
jgi:pimeloyl-ACP methyl ester carboxylesterase